MPDPEIPVLTLDDLGILRGVDIAADGTVLVTLTPTYTGCPATAAIAADVETALRAAGAHRVSVRTVLSPAWTTDWMGPDAHRKLREYGIAPPGACRPAPVGAAVRRPRSTAGRGDPVRPLPAVRFAAHPGDQPVRLHPLQGPVVLPVLRRTLRFVQVDLT